MITLHWSVLFAIGGVACIFGFAVAAICASAIPASRCEECMCSDIIDSEPDLAEGLMKCAEFQSKVKP